MSLTSTAPEKPQPTCCAMFCPPSSAVSHGQNQCAGAIPLRIRTACAGCGRCIALSAPSGRKPKSRRLSILRWAASVPPTSLMAIGLWHLPQSKCGAFLITSSRLKRPRSCSTPPAAARLFSPTLKRWHLRMGWSWLKTKACSMKLPDWSNGPWCWWALSIRRFWIFRARWCAPPSAPTRSALCCATRKPTSSRRALSSPLTSKPRTMAPRLPQAMAALSAPACLTRCIFGKPTRKTCRTLANMAASSISAWQNYAHSILCSMKSSAPKASALTASLL